LIVVDTLRADHLSCYGYPLETTPNLNEFSWTAVLYERCYSPANWTPPGHASIFTGRYPVSHGAHKARLDQGSRYPTCFPLLDQETTLAELLSEAGYVTAAVVANYGFVSTAYGLDQGFQHWFASPPTRTRFTLVSIITKVLPRAVRRFTADAVFYRRASEICRIALDWIRQHRDRPFFLFVNLMDPHEPYAPPSDWDQAFGGKIEGFVPNANELRMGQTSFSASEWQHIRSQYDGEIAYVDSELGKFFGALDWDGILSQSIVVVTSDHGEFLGEKGLLDHQIGLYEPVIRVPGPPHHQGCRRHGPATSRR
jgi:arylsulfatase A-like enzyme